MAGENNPFFISPVNPLQALMMGAQGYKQGQEFSRDAAIDEAATAIKKGDNPALMDALLRARQIGPAIEIAKLSRQQQASNDFAKSLAPLFPQTGATAPVTPVSSSPLARLIAPEQNTSQPNPAPQAPSAPPASTATPVNLTDPRNTTTGVEYGPVTNPKTGQTIAEAPQAVPTTPQVAPQNAPAQRPLTGQVGPSPTLGGVPLEQAVPALLKAVSDPNLPKEQQEFARIMLGKAMDAYPQEIRKLEIFKVRPDLLDIETKLKTAGATLINTAPGLDAAQAQARIDIDKHAVAELSKKVANSRSALPLINQMIEMGDKIPGGWAGQASPFFAKALSTFGVAVPEGASNAELFQAASRQFIPSIRDPGSTSNYEQQLYSQSVPSLMQSVEGRKKVGIMFRAMNERNAEVLAVYRKNVGSPELDDKLKALDAKPMFSKEDRKLLEGEVARSGGATSSGEIDALVQKWATPQ